MSKIISVFLLMLMLSACASSGSNSALRSSYSSVPADIAYAPAIDVPYSEVVDNVQEHVGTSVRWGGQIIKSEELESVTRLTVFAYPLNKRGKPNSKADDEFAGGRFVVDIDKAELDQENFDNRYITVYGPVMGGLTLTNGNKEKTIPIVAALEATEWGRNDRRRYYDARYGYAYHSLAFRYGHSRYRHGRYRHGLYGHRYGFYGSPVFGYHYSYYPRRYRHRNHRW